MTGLLLPLALAAALAFAVLWWHERRVRREAEKGAEKGRPEPTTATQPIQGADRFFDLVTHELRSPLAAILGYQELLADGTYGGLDQNATEPIERIGRAARHLLHLIDGLLELSRLRSGGLTPSLESVDLRLVLSTLADGFRTHARERGLEPTVHLPDTLPAIRSDRERLERALHLVAISVLRHPADHEVELDARTTHGGVDVRISGARIQLEDDAADPAVRLGLRLAVADGLIRLLGGELVLHRGAGGVVHAVELRLRDAAGP